MDDKFMAIKKQKFAWVLSVLLHLVAIFFLVFVEFFSKSPPPKEESQVIDVSLSTLPQAQNTDKPTAPIEEGVLKEAPPKDVSPTAEPQEKESSKEVAVKKATPSPTPSKEVLREPRDVLEKKSEKTPEKTPESAAKEEKRIEAILKKEEPHEESSREESPKEEGPKTTTPPKAPPKKTPKKVPEKAPEKTSKKVVGEEKHLDNLLNQLKDKKVPEAKTLESQLLKMKTPKEIPVKEKSLGEKPLQNEALLKEQGQALSKILKKEDKHQSSSADASAHKDSVTLKQKAQSVHGQKVAALSQSVINSFRAQVESCWRSPVGFRDLKNVSVVLRVFFNKNGTLTAAPTVMESYGEGRSVVEQSAIKALEVCQPFNLPEDEYDLWRETNIEFSAQGME